MISRALAAGSGSREVKPRMRFFLHARLSYLIFIEMETPVYRFRQPNPVVEGQANAGRAVPA